MFDRKLKNSETIQEKSEEENEKRTSKAGKESDVMIMNNIG